MNLCSYHLQEAGATPVQEIAYTLSTAIAVLDAVRDAGNLAPADMTSVVARLSFFVNAGLRFIEEVCKLRALSLLWERLGRERYGVTVSRRAGRRLPGPPVSRCKLCGLGGHEAE